MDTLVLFDQQKHPFISSVRTVDAGPTKSNGRLKRMLSESQTNPVCVEDNDDDEEFTHPLHVRGAFNKSLDVFVQAYKIDVDS